MRTVLLSHISLSVLSTATLVLIFILQYMHVVRICVFMAMEWAYDPMYSDKSVT